MSATGFGNPKAFGAVGDGVADDTTALRNCIAAFLFIIIPEGTYKITGSLTLRTGQTIIGASKVSTVIAAYGCAAFIGSSLLSSPTGCWNIFLSNMSIKGYGSVANCDGVFLLGNNGLNTAQNTLDNLIISGFTRHGVYINRPILTTVRSVHSEGNSGMGFVFEGDGTSLTVQNCWAKANGSHGYYLLNNIPYSVFVNCASDANTGDAYFLDSSTLISQSHNISFISCGAEANLGNSFHLAGVLGITLTSCFVYPGATAVGGHFFFLDGVKHATLTGCYAAQTPASGKYALNIGTLSGTSYPTNIHASGCSFQSINNSNSALELDIKGWATAGNATVQTHNLGVVPTQVFLTCADPSIQATADTFTSTTFRLLLQKNDGTTPSGSYPVTWRSYA